MHARRLINALAWGCAAGLALAAFAPDATGQSRNKVSLRTPGSLRQIGSGTSVHNFRGFSYGLGSLSVSGKMGGGALHSSIANSGMTVPRGHSLRVPNMAGVRPGGSLLARPPSTRGLSVRRGGANSSVSTTGLAAGIPTPPRPPTAPVLPGMSVSPLTGIDGEMIGPMKAPEAPDRALPEAIAGGADLARTSIADMLAKDDDTALGAARAYLQALEETATQQLKRNSEPVTRLVPTVPSEYRDHMAKGDSAFRTQNFHLAKSEFRIANDLGDRDPESFIYLTHTHFALGHYSLASYYLQQAVKKLPELPLVPLRPKGFYDSAGKYAEHMVALEEYLEKDPRDAHAQFILAYFRWFATTQDVRAAHQALAMALTNAVAKDDADLVEAVETFWDGMVASGKVSGKLSAVPAAGTPAGARRVQPR